MKKLITSVVLMLFVTVSYAQIVIDGQDINELEDVQYLEVLVTQKFLSNKVVITVNYGQRIKNFKGSTILVDGKARVFNNVVDVLNFFYARGWKYLDALVLTIQGQNVYHYYMERKEE